MKLLHTPQRTKPSLKHSLSILGLAVAALLAARSATAQDSSSYFGLGGGQTRGHLDERRITDSATNPSLNAGSTTLATDRRDAGYKVFGGYQLNRYLGLELGYFNLGKQGFNVDASAARRLVAEVRTQGANFDVVGSLPFTDNLSGLARAGLTYARTRTEFGSVGAVPLVNARPSDRGANPKVGLGLQYAFGNNFLMRGEAERYRINDAVGGHGRINLYSVSLVFPLGRTASAAPRSAYVAPAPAPMPAPVAQTAAPMAQAPAAQPVVVAPPAVMQPAPQRIALRRVSYTAESMFGFDASTVLPEGRAALDTFAGELSGTAYDSISVEGHTDRLGSTAYNQALSQRRAESVKDYLVRVKGVNANKVNASGKSERSPVTKPEDCKGNTANAALISCLQPDRRVEIEVSGTR